MWKILPAANDRSMLVVSSLMGRVVARLTNDHTVVQGVCSSELGVTNVVSMGDLAMRVLRSSRFAEAGDS